MRVRNELTCLIQSLVDFTVLLIERLSTTDVRNGAIHPTNEKVITFIKANKGYNPSIKQLGGACKIAETAPTLLGMCLTINIKRSHGLSQSKVLDFTYSIC